MHLYRFTSITPAWALGNKKLVEIEIIRNAAKTFISKLVSLRFQFPTKDSRGNRMKCHPFTIPTHARL